MPIKHHQDKAMLIEYVGPQEQKVKRGRNKQYTFLPREEFGGRKVAEVDNDSLNYFLPYKAEYVPYVPPDQPPATSTTEALMGIPINTLRRYAKGHGIKLGKGMGKADIVALLIQKDALGLLET